MPTIRSPRSKCLGGDTGRGSPEPGFCVGDSGISSPVIRGETRLGRFAGAGFLLRADQTYKPRMLRFHGGSPGEVSPRGFLQIGCGVRRLISASRMLI